jgi:hypothetical protein
MLRSMFVFHVLEHRSNGNRQHHNFFTEETLLTLLQSATFEGIVDYRLAISSPTEQRPKCSTGPIHWNTTDDIHRPFSKATQKQTQVAALTAGPQQFNRVGPWP